MLLAILIPKQWSQFVVPDVALLEIFLRGTIVYLFLFFALRFIMKRESAGVGISDVLVIVLIADAVQNGMAGEYNSVPDALMLAITIIGWDYALSFLAFHVETLRPIIRPERLLLISAGKVLKESARKELLTLQEIQGQLHQQGIRRIEDVAEAWVESDGMITAIPKSQENDEPKQKKEKQIN
jgi:uncharacterized membrane protein YcaP (DUF421 family)